jgi:signal transduction histidine kinase/ActR/RegA family two-component response regulator
VGIWRFEDGGRALRCLVRFDRGEGSLVEDRIYSPRLAAEFRLALELTTALAVEDTQRSPSVSPAFEEWVAAEGVRAALLLPVRAEGRLVGLVSFEEGRSPRSWSSAERDLAVALAHQVRGALAGPMPTPGLPPPVGRSPSNGSALAEESIAETSVEPAPAELPRRTPVQGAGRSKTLLRRIPPLEGAALLAGERIDDLLRVLEIQGGYLSLLEDELSEHGSGVELVDEVREAGRRIGEGLRDFLIYLREGIPRGEAIDLNGAIAGFVPALAREAGDSLRLRIAPTAEPLPVEVNPDLLERALIHLVRNAREASAPGGDVRIAWGPVPPTEEPGGAPVSGLARIRVEDRGEGVPAEDLPWLFEPFFSNRRGDRPLGGIGLAVVQSVVEGHGGWVEVSSRVGEGTTVDLFLPLAVSAVGDAKRSEAVASDSAPAVEPRPAPRILILEDEPLLARLLERTLSRSGYRVEVAAAPVEAERKWRRLGQGVDVVVTERTLAGGRSGIDPVRRWRMERPGLGLVVLDRHAPAGSSGRAPDGEPYLTRPFEPADVLNRVREVLASRERSAEEPGEDDPPTHSSDAVRTGGGPVAH